LFGTAEELTGAEADEVLRAAGIDVEQLKRQAYERLYREAQSYWNKNEELPPRLKKALADLRPDDLPPRSATEAHRQAETVIDKLLKPIYGIVLAPLSYSYRGKKSVSPNDQSALDRLGEKLKKRIESKKQEDRHE
jgi:molybdopterin converting factor small subunit